MKFFRVIFILNLLLLGIMSCGDDDMKPIDGGDNNPTDNFDRTAMLTFWADEIIIPGYENYTQALGQLKKSSDAFIVNPIESTFDELSADWLKAYKAWQGVSIFEIGEAESIGLRNFTNIFPTDTEGILNNIDNGDYNLVLPSNFDTQGFPALDYLLFGMSDDKSEMINLLAQEVASQYLNDLVTRLNDLGNQVLDDWKGTYRNDFVNNNTSSATASVDKIVNDFLFYYEKYLRAGKIGIPAGVFSGNEISTSVEAPYSGIYSLELFNESLDAVQDFFNGKSNIDGIEGESLASYLEYLNTIIEGDDLVAQINNQWNIARNKAQELNPNFTQQIEEDNIKMLETYDELQKVVVFLKVDMLQVLNIKVDFVDADGD